MEVDSSTIISTKKEPSPKQILAVFCPTVVPHLESSVSLTLANREQSRIGTANLWRQIERYGSVQTLWSR